MLYSNINLDRRSDWSDCPKFNNKMKKKPTTQSKQIQNTREKSQKEAKTDTSTHKYMNLNTQIHDISTHKYMNLNTQIHESQHTNT